jgi:hypothetical protein
MGFWKLKRVVNRSIQVMFFKERIVKAGFDNIYPYTREIAFSLPVEQDFTDIKIHASPSI